MSYVMKIMFIIQLIAQLTLWNPKTGVYIQNIERL